MRSHRENISDEARRLRTLVRELRKTKVADGAPEELVILKRSFGEDAPVRRWFAAETFLRRWQEWKSYREGWMRLTGVKPPELWNKAANECRGMQDRLLSKSWLLEALYVNWQRWMEEEPSQNVRSFTFWIVGAANISGIAGLLATNEAVESGLSESLQSVARQIDARLADGFRQTTPNLQRAVRNRLQHYARATLRTREDWKSAENDCARFFFDERNPMDPEALIKTLADAGLLENSPEGLRAALRKIAGMIGDLGYSRFRDELIELGSVAIGGGAGFSVIPADDYAEPREILVALASGGRSQSKGSLPSILDEVNDYLVKDSQDVTKTVIVITDFFDQQQFERDFYQRFQNWHQDRKKQFLFLQVGVPDTQLASIPIRF